jgi:hypothetical protein
MKSADFGVPHALALEHRIYSNKCELRIAIPSGLDGGLFRYVTFANGEDRVPMILDDASGETGLPCAGKLSRNAPQGLLLFDVAEDLEVVLPSLRGLQKGFCGASPCLVPLTLIEARDDELQLRDLGLDLGDAFGDRTVADDRVTGSITCLSLGIGHCHLQ